MTLVAIGVMACTVFLLRISGFLLAGAVIPASLDRALRFAPIATLSAVTVAVITRGSATGSVELVALGAGALAAWMTRKLWVCIAVGIGVAVVLRNVTG
jgi:branched-subunit amino acid transport protein